MTVYIQCLFCTDTISEESSLPLLKAWTINFEGPSQSIKEALQYLYQHSVLADSEFVTPFYVFLHLDFIFLSVQSSVLAMTRHSQH